MNCELKKHYYRVSGTIYDVPLHDALRHGFEDKYQFRDAIRNLLSRWQGYTGECLETKHDGEFLLLRFVDIPGGSKDQAWLPKYLLTEVPRPDFLDVHERTELEKEIDAAYGFDD